MQENSHFFDLLVLVCLPVSKKAGRQPLLLTFVHPVLVLQPGLRLGYWQYYLQWHFHDHDLVTTDKTLGYIPHSIGWWFHNYANPCPWLRCLHTLQLLGWVLWSQFDDVRQLWFSRRTESKISPELWQGWHRRPWIDPSSAWCTNHNGKTVWIPLFYIHEPQENMWPTPQPNWFGCRLQHSWTDLLIAGYPWQPHEKINPPEDPQEQLHCW